MKLFVAYISGKNVIPALVAETIQTNDKLLPFKLQKSSEIKSSEMLFTVITSMGLRSISPSSRTDV